MRYINLAAVLYKYQEKLMTKCHGQQIIPYFSVQVIGMKDLPADKEQNNSTKFRIFFVLADFDDRLWFSLVDFATVYSAEDVRFTFKDGTEIKA